MTKQLSNIINKAKIVGNYRDNNDWAVTVEIKRGVFTIITEQGRIDKEYTKVKLDEYFVIAKAINNTEIYVRGSINPIKFRGSIRDVHVAYDDSNPNSNGQLNSAYGPFRYVGEPKRHCGYAALVSLKTAKYIITDTGNKRKITNRASFLRLGTNEHKDIIYIFGSVFGGEAIGWVNRELTIASTPNMFG